MKKKCSVEQIVGVLKQADAFSRMAATNIAGICSAPDIAVGLLLVRLSLDDIQAVFMKHVSSVSGFR